MNSWFLRLALIGAMVTPTAAHAYFSTIDNGELLAPGKYQISLEPQLIFNRYDGGNVVGRFDAGLNESSGVRGLFGVGKVDFQVGGFYKWIPFPDVDNQPAIGLDAGAILARVQDHTEFSIRLHPLISKRFEAEVGDFIPYASLPLGITTRPEKAVFPVQIEIGTEFRPLNYSRWSVFGELGVSITEAFSYVSVAAAYRFDDDMVRRRARKD